MKGNKKILLAIALLLLISATFTTLAIYRSTATATGTIDAAQWSVQVNGTSIETASFTFDISDIQWTTHTGKNNTIAPGDTGVIVIPVDASGSEVDVKLEATLGTTTLPAGMTVALASDSTTEIAYASTMTGNIKLEVTWSGTISDATGKDTTDKAAAGTSLSIPVTLVARQKLSSD